MRPRMSARAKEEYDNLCKRGSDSQARMAAAGDCHVLGGSHCLCCDDVEAIDFEQSCKMSSRCQQHQGGREGSEAYSKQ